MKKTKIGIFLILTICTSAKACDCIPVWTFIDTSCKDCDVFLGEIVKDKTIDGKNNGCLFSDFRTVLIIDHLQGNSNIDTVRILQGSGTVCLGGLVQQDIGDIVLITGSIQNDIALKNEKIIDVKTVTIGSCNVQSLIYNKGYVYGNITKNKKRNREKIWRNILKLVPNFIIDKSEKRYLIYNRLKDRNPVQKMSLEKLKHKLKRKYGT